MLLEIGESKTTRELLVDAQEALMFMSGQFVSAGARQRVDDLQRLINEIDAQTPPVIHGDFHTLDCGCFPNNPAVNHIMNGSRYHSLSPAVEEQTNGYI